ncbi:hypothetical protein JGUZn3_05690 [Entomobacter blattae]|uniref:Uncharacterized protein n=1 Tax=Entomobacter blattae TaxID=2762277 RepID=A0A7H1NPV4_9PROT|nr:hypothetical protein JGUZn3_05690 [Entomobacter blattae]
MLDISLGRMFSKMLREKGYNPIGKKLPHIMGTREVVDIHMMQPLPIIAPDQNGKIGQPQ